MVSLKKIAQNTLKGLVLPSFRGRSPQKQDLFTSYMLFNNKASWINTQTLIEYFSIYGRNPVFHSAVNIKARAAANVRIQVKNKITGDIEQTSTTAKIPQKIYSLLEQPNPLQSTWEFFRQKKIFHEVAGNSFVYGNCPVGFKMNIENVSTLVNPWPQYMSYNLAGGYFDATEISQIIKNWRFQISGYYREWDPQYILHQNYPNVNPLGLKLTGFNPIMGTSVIESLKWPLSNIEMAYESRNVVIKNRGMRAIITSEAGDATGKIPITAKEKEELQKDFREYGTLEDQDQFMFSRFPMNVNMIDQDVRKLGLFEEIASDGMIVSNTLGVPATLLKLDLKGETFSNQDASERRLYQDTIIPETNDDIVALNNWFGLRDTEWEIIGSFDHLPFLQKDKEKAARGNRQKSAYLKELFLSGAITHNQWLTELEMEPYKGGDKRIFEFDEHQIDIILGNLKKEPK